MTISTGSRLGPYEVLSPLGAGGMGEVWLARDSRLGREVALKVLPEEVSSDSSRLHRFEKEARSASALNHPNIVTVYEIGSAESVSYIAMELVEGKTLRELLFGGALPLRRLLQLAPQMADGLARAHEAGIVHRDLKPENVMVTKDGLVKILDCGLAKLTRAEPEGAASLMETLTRGTEPGVVMGTVGYMSPEQASGEAVDYRSDQFSFGSILYEMATGKRAFQKKRAVETLSAILNEEPEPIGQVNPQAPVPLRWIVERCLAKELEGRYASTKDLARDLANVRDHLSEAVSGGVIPATAHRRRTRLRVAVAAGALLAAGIFAGRPVWRQPPPSPPKFQRLTFRRGFIDTARFSPDGQTILYSARWDGDPPHVFQTRPENPSSQRLDLPDASLLSISPRGELAIVSGKMQIGPWLFAGGTLATVPIAGGAPREIATDVQLADWAPDGRQMAVIRNNRLEFPLGKVIYTPARGQIAVPRVSPAGNRIAFLNLGGRRVHVVDLSGKERFVSRQLGPVSLVWSPSGDEIWVSAGLLPSAAGDTLYAMSPTGKERVLYRSPRGLILWDISRDGRVLLAAGHGRWEVWSKPAGQNRERDVSVLGGSDAMGLTPDGKTVLVNEGSLGPGAEFYLSHADGSPPKKLGEGYASDLSADGKWAVVVRPGPPSRLVLVPTGAGEERALESGAIEEYDRENIRWAQNGGRLLFGAREKGHSDRLYVQDIEGGKPRPLTPDGLHTESSSISPDGRLVIVEQRDGFWLYPVDGGDKRLVRGLRPLVDFVWRNWSEDGRFVYAWEPTKLPFEVYRVNIATGQRESWMTILPQDPAGIWNADLMLTPDGKSYAYNCRRGIQDLFLVEGLK